MAIGRVAETGGLGLDKIGVVSDKSSGKIKTTDEQTSIPNIYALGDVINVSFNHSHFFLKIKIIKGPELTPVAIKAGRWLAKRLYGKSHEKYRMDYENVPTTVFTPLEYSSIGMTEEQALERLGEAAEVRENATRRCPTDLSTRSTTLLFNHSNGPCHIMKKTLVILK